MKNVLRSGLSVVMVGVLLANMGAQVVWAAPVTPVNEISNPTFLLGGGLNNGPQNWNAAAWGDAGGAVFTYPVAGQDDNFGAQVSISSYGTNVGGGAAEWYFNPVPVTGNGFYTFSDWYRSTTDSYLVAQFTLNNSLNHIYLHLATLPQTNGGWVKTTQQFSVPANATAMTVFHLLQSTGTLTVDNYSLLASTAPDSNLFDQGMVSLTFDDGYSDQMKYALPALSAAGLKGTFYIIPNPVIQNINLLTNSAISTADVTTNSSVTWGNIANGSGDAIYTDPTNQDYSFSENYTATTGSTISVNYCNIIVPSGNCLPANTISAIIGTLPAAAVSTRASFNFTLPAISGSTTTPISITQTLTGAGTLNVTKPFMSGTPVYMTPLDLLTLQSAGQEIGSHATDHCDLVQLYNNPNSALTTVGCPDYALSTPSTAQSQISDSKSALLSMGTSPVNSFAYPFGNYTSAIEQLVSSANYTNGRSVDVGYNTKSSDPFSLKVQNIDPTTSVAQIESWIDTAVANKLWLILVFHQIENQNVIDTNGDIYGATPDTLQQVVSYLSNHNVSVPTVSEGTALMTAVTPPPPPVTPSTPVASPIAGTYATAQSVTLSSANSTSIYYTLDGSAPVCLTGNVYGGAITVSSSTNVKAVGCNTAESSGVASFNYVITGNGPVVTVPADMTVQATSSSGATVSFTATATDEVEGSLTPVCAPVSGSTFPVGVTPVTCTATNSHSQSASASFNVTVQAVTQSAQPSITVLSPDQSKTYTAGTFILQIGFNTVGLAGKAVQIGLKNMDTSVVYPMAPFANVDLDGTQTVFNEAIPSTVPAGTHYRLYLSSDAVNATSLHDLTIIGVTQPAAIVTVSSGGGGGGGGSALALLNKAGDINHDSKVDEFDYAILLSQWGLKGSQTADLSHDGVVDETDLAILMFNWGK